MKPSTCVVAVHELQQAIDPAQQLFLLKTIENDIVGNPLRKRQAVRNGLLPILRPLITCAISANDVGPALASDPGSIPSQLHTHATRVIACIARGGICFAAPIRASGLLEDLMTVLSFHAILCTRAKLATLRALADIAYGSMDFSDGSYDVPEFSRTSVQGDILAILNETVPTGRDERRLIRTACLMIMIVNHATSTKNVLLPASILTSLEYLLANYASRTRVPMGDSEPLLDADTLSWVLEAMAALVRTSTYQKFRLILSPVMSKFLTESASISQAFPQMPASKAKPVSKSFPAPLPKSVQAIEHPQYAIAAADPLCEWLIVLARTTTRASLRLSALKLLGRISDVTVGPHAYSRHKRIVLLAVPLLVTLVRDSSLDPDKENGGHMDDSASSILADMVGDHPLIQKAAADAGAVKFLCALLKKTFKTTLPPKQFWSPVEFDEDSSSEPSCQLGSDGLPQGLANVMHVRQACLRALRATAVVRPGEVQLDPSTIACICECLVPVEETTNGAELTAAGNTIRVLLAACALLREVSKVTSQARTSLVDAQVAKPLMKLISHPNIDVRIAATWVCSNLLTPVSSLRQDLLDAGIIKVLVDHAKATFGPPGSSLQHASLWALKHVAAEQTVKLRLEVLNSLGADLILSTFDTGSMGALGQKFKASNAAHESVDLLHSKDDMDADMSDMGEDLESKTVDAEDKPMADVSGEVYRASKMRSTLDMDPSRVEFLRLLQQWETTRHVQIMRNHDVIQAQVLLLLANICLPPDQNEAIESIDRTIGLNRLLEIIRSRFEAPIMDWDTYTSLRNWKEGQPLPTDAVSNEVVFAAMKLLCHLAAGSDRFMGQLIEHRDMFSSFMGHFEHPDSQIRVLALWTILNLTLPDVSDVAAARQRASELREMGVEERIRPLAEDDSHDVRERARTALRQFDYLK